MSIRAPKLNNGKTVYDVMLRRPDGSQYSRTFGAKHDARTWEAQELADRSRHRWIDPTAGDELLASYAERWIANRPNLRPRTLEVYRSQLRRHVLPTFGETSLQAITKQAVRTWYADLQRRRSQVLAAKCYRLLAAMMNTAVDDELIGRSPCRIRGAAEERSPERPLPTIQELFAIADAIDPRYRALVLLAGLCGLRMGELQGLTRADLDLLHRTVSVTKQAQELADRIAITEPKTKAGRRVVTLPDTIIADLEHHLAEWVRPEPGAPFFTGPKGGLRRATIYKEWPKALVAAGVERRYRLHDLRHLANTLAARVPGTTTKDLMARIGHASAQASLRYQHTSIDADRLISAGIDAVVTEARASSASDRPSGAS
jgi:integrase